MPILSITSKQNHTTQLSRVAPLPADNRHIDSLATRTAISTEIKSISNVIQSRNGGKVTHKALDCSIRMLNSYEKLLEGNKENRINLAESKNEYIGLLQESRNINNEAKALISEYRNLPKFKQEPTDPMNAQRDLLQQSRGLLHELEDIVQTGQNFSQICIDHCERTLAKMMKNPARYGGLDNAQFQNLPEIVETKQEIMKKVVSVKLQQYPREEHEALKEAAEKAIDRFFFIIKPININNDLSWNKKPLWYLEEDIDLALAQRYTLIKNDYLFSSEFKSYRVAQKGFYDFLNVSIHDFKV